VKDNIKEIYMLMLSPKYRKEFFGPYKWTDSYSKLYCGNLAKRLGR
jgi:hypothetical protein